MSVITLEELQTYSSDQEIDADRGQLTVNAVNEFVESTTGRHFGGIDEVTDEVHDSGSVIFLRHQDVTEVTSVKRGRGNGQPTTLNADSYYVNPYGRLVLSEARNGFGVYRDYVKVSYKYGVASVPADLKLAALSIAADFYTYAANGNIMATEIQVGSYKEKVAAGQDTSTGMQHFGVINRYRTRNI